MAVHIREAGPAMQSDMVVNEASRVSRQGKLDVIKVVVQRIPQARQSITQFRGIDLRLQFEALIDRVEFFSDE